jgi:CRP-like cAMP-binding protein
MTSAVQGSPQGRDFPLTPVAHHNLKLVPNQAVALLKKYPTFVPEIPINKYISGRTRLECETGESIYSQGDIADAVYYIQSGKVKLTVVSMSGKEAVIAYLTAGSFFGESALAGESLRVSSACALQSCIIIRIGKMVMQDLLHREQKFAEQFLTYLVSRNNRMQADLVDHLFNSSEKRLARLLMLMANFGEESKPIPAIPKISQETLAEMIGTTRSRVSFFLNRFRDLGYIDYSVSGMRINSSLVNVVLND